MKKLIMLFLACTTVSLAQDLKNNEAPVFIIKMADSRLMAREEGRLAAGLASTQAIRDYGSRMVKEQETLHTKFNQLAASKNITLPDAISEKKSSQLSKLSALRSKAFDRRFVRMIKADHKRDVKMFKKATRFEDEATRKFAQENLALVQQHLDGAKTL